MRSYFIRHTDKLLISRSEMSRLYCDNRIFIHYPGSGAEDLATINPDAYEGNDRNVIRRFRDLSVNGGYVWAQYTSEENAKIGTVVPGTPVELVWSVYAKGNDAGRKAILKTLQVTNVREVRPDELMSLRAARPRQGTISQWKRVVPRLKAAVLGEKPPLAWENLATPQQEIACAEFLRSHREPDLPRLRALLLPPGGSLKDVDIYGIAVDRHMLFGQVTHYTRGRNAVEKKVERLRAYGGDGNHLVFFCRCPQVEQDGEVIFVPVSLVESWLDGDTLLRKELMERL